MKGIIISNIKIDGLGPIDFYRNESFKKWGVSVNWNPLLPKYVEWFKEAVGAKAETPAKDVELSQSEIKSVQDVFSKLLEKKLENWKKIDVPPNERITFQGKDYEIRVSPVRPLDYDVWDFYNIYKLCEECLEAKKPMYLSVE